MATNRLHTETLQQSGYKIFKRITSEEVVLEDEFGQRELWKEVFGSWYGYAVEVDMKPYVYVGKLLGKR